MCNRGILASAGMGYAPFWDRLVKRLTKRGANLAELPSCSGGVVAQHLCDWEAKCQFFGFRAHSSQTPCPHCKCDLEHFHDYANPAPPRTHADWLLAYNATRVHVSVNVEQARDIQTKLIWDIKARGRALSEDFMVGGVQLLRGDRLERSDSLFDPGLDLTSLTGYPAGLDLFRPSPDACITSWNPLLRTGVLVQENILGDIMHSGDLGGSQYNSGAVFGFCLRRGIAGIPNRTQDVMLTQGVEAPS